MSCIGVCLNTTQHPLFLAVYKPTAVHSEHARSSLSLQKQQLVPVCLSHSVVWEQLHLYDEISFVRFHGPTASKHTLHLLNIYEWFKHITMAIQIEKSVNSEKCGKHKILIPEEILRPSFSGWYSGNCPDWYRNTKIFFFVFLWLLM